MLPVDSCDPGKGQNSTGSIQLSLVPGYGADTAAHQPVTRPTIPLKWGVRPTDGGDLIFQVLNDPLGIYQDAGSDYWEVYVPGIPGLVEVRLEASTVEKPRFTSFADAPYPLRLRFFTNGGVREYQFNAPPVLKQFSESLAEIAARISRCYAIGANLVLRKYLEIRWLVDPPEERGGKVAQQWDVHLRGLEAGRTVTVWNAETGQVMVRAFTDGSRRVDVSLLLSGQERVSNLLMSLDDEPFLPTAEVRKLHSPEAEAGSPTSTVELLMRQTALTEIDSLDFDHQIESLQLVQIGENGQHKQSALSVRTRNGSEFALTIPGPYSSGMATPRASVDLNAQILNNVRSAQAFWRGKKRQFAVISQFSGRTEILAEYHAPSTYDLAAGRDDLLAQVSVGGRRVTLYQRSVGMILGPMEPRHDHGPKGDLPHPYGSKTS
jgi:hypothetical protein